MKQHSHVPRPGGTDHAIKATGEAGSTTTRVLSRSWTLLTGEERVRPVTLVCWLVVAGLLIWALVATSGYDFRDDPPAGDEVAFLFAGLSVADNGGLGYDASDVERWEDAGWTDKPNVLFFQRNADYWAFAKPYGYSVWLGPAIAALGVERGVAIANSVLFLLLVGVAVAILRLRFSGVVVPILTASFFFACAPHLYRYVIGPELFLALLIASILLCVLLYWRTEKIGFAIAAFAGLGFAASEKTPLLALLLPVAVVIVWRERRRAARVALVLTLLGSTAIAISPYLYYSNGDAWNAYAGERFVTASGDVPFEPDPDSRKWTPTGTEEEFEASTVIRNTVDEPVEAVKSLGYYFVGRYTGLIMILPTAVLLLVAVVLRVRNLTATAWALLIGVVGYILFYVVVFTDNYYGTIGIGNRYFIQIAPSVLALAVVARITPRAALVAALVGAALGVAILWPQHQDPANAWGSFGRTSWVQRALPVEKNQDNIWQYDLFRVHPFAWLPEFGG